MVHVKDAEAKSRSDAIRDHVRKTYFEPARKRGQHRIKVIAGDVHRDMALQSRVPMVCAALRSKDLLRGARVRIVADDGPPSGQSTTVAITYELLPDEGKGSLTASSRYAAFQRLRGVAKETFESLGGGEDFIRKERERFFDKEKE